MGYESYDDGKQTIDVSSTSRGDVLTKDYLQKVPTGRSYQSAVQMAGGSSNENTYMLDGATITEPQGGVNFNMAQSSPQSEYTVTPPPAAAEARMVHYSGWLRIGVTKVRDELERLAKLAEERGGRVEALGGNTIVLRIPVDRYRDVWAEIRQDGDVLAENQTASDVTEQFSAVDLRVKTATVTRDRLVALLAKAESEQDKVTLLRELLRVTEELDGLQSQLRALRGLADYSRIVVEVAQKGALAAANGPEISGFEWIGWLSPFQPLLSDARRVQLDVPTGMVELQPRGQFVAESPEGARLSTTRIPNDPRAEPGFWISAIQDRLAPDFAAAERSTVGDWACLRLADGSDDPYTWEICARGDVADRTFDLAQAYYPDEATLARYGAGVREALQGGADAVAEGGG